MAGLTINNIKTQFPIMTELIEAELKRGFYLPHLTSIKLKGQFPDLTDKERQTMKRDGFIRPRFTGTLANLLKERCRALIVQRKNVYKLYYEHYILTLEYKKGVLDMSLEDRLVFEDEILGESTKLIFTKCTDMDEVFNTLQLYNRISKGTFNLQTDRWLEDYAKTRNNASEPYGLVRYTKI